MKKSDNNSAICIPIGMMYGCSIGTAMGILFGTVISAENLGLCMLYGCSIGCSLGLLAGALLCIVLNKRSRK